MMLKSMRDANAVLGEQRTRTYQEMFDKQIALEMSQGKGLGLGDLMVRQLGAAVDATGRGGRQRMPAASDVHCRRRPAAIARRTTGARFRSRAPDTRDRCCLP